MPDREVVTLLWGTLYEHLDPDEQPKVVYPKPLNGDHKPKPRMASARLCSSVRLVGSPAANGDRCWQPKLKGAPACNPILPRLQQRVRAESLSLRDIASPANSVCVVRCNPVAGAWNVKIDQRSLIHTSVPNDLPVVGAIGKERSLNHKPVFVVRVIIPRDQYGFSIRDALQ